MVVGRLRLAGGAKGDPTTPRVTRSVQTRPLWLANQRTVMVPISETGPPILPAPDGPQPSAVSKAALDPIRKTPYPVGGHRPSYRIVNQRSRSARPEEDWVDRLVAVYKLIIHGNSAHT